MEFCKYLSNDISHAVEIFTGFEEIHFGVKKGNFPLFGTLLVEKFHYTLLNLDKNCITSELLYPKFSKNLKKANFEVHKYFNTFPPSKYNISNVSFSIISDIKNHL